MLPSANHTIPQEQRWLPAGPRKMQQDKVHLQKALAVTTQHISTPRSQKGAGEGEYYMKKPKRKIAMSKIWKSHSSNIPRETKALLLYED